MKSANRKLKVPIHTFTACAKFGKNPRYDLLLELHDKSDKRQLKMLIKMFDEELKKLNIEYKAKRDSERLGKSVLKLVKEGNYSRLHKSRAGTHDTQVKITSLTQDPSFEDDFEIMSVITY